MAGTGSLTTSGELRNDFLTLLTTQLRHQDPLSPTDSTEFIGQLSQFTTLERMESMNSHMDDLVDLAKKQLEQGKPSEVATPADLTQSALLLGRQVEYRYQAPSTDPNVPAKPTIIKTGTVETVTLKEGKVLMTMNNGDQIKLTDVSTVKADLTNAPSSPTPPRTA